MGPGMTCVRHMQLHVPTGPGVWRLAAYGADEF